MQLIYRTSHADGEKLVADPRVGATGYTGSRDDTLEADIAENWLTKSGPRARSKRT